VLGVRIAVGLRGYLFKLSHLEECFSTVHLRQSGTGFHVAYVLVRKYAGACRASRWVH